MTYKDKKGCWITAGLFKETAGTNGKFVVWTLDEAARLFVEEGDMTGYQFAMKYLGGYNHWQAVKHSKALEPHIESWCDELEMKLRSESLLRIGEQAELGHYQANKFLTDRGWSTRGAGRPTKAAVKNAIAKDKKLTAVVSPYMNRLKD